MLEFEVNMFFTYMKIESPKSIKFAKKVTICT